ncbi:MAG: hypothetical protein K2L07_04700, partial [Lachnospiraceae bacterium]|nr:hypothetical protein [Lachnospiraceae bacterium]
MKKIFCTAMFACLIFLAGCGQSGTVTDLSSKRQDNASGTTVFVSGMGCSDRDCTDTSHHHDCPPDCGDYEHYHNCDLDCTEASHHHANTGREEDYQADSTADVTSSFISGMEFSLYPFARDQLYTDTSFVNGMGCSDPDCTDTSHHHDCPPDCGDYEHYHNCDLDCTEA